MNSLLREDVREISAAHGGGIPQNASSVVVCQEQSSPGSRHAPAGGTGKGGER